MLIGICVWTYDIFIAIEISVQLTIFMTSFDYSKVLIASECINLSNKSATKSFP